MNSEDRREMMYSDAEDFLAMMTNREMVDTYGAFIKTEDLARVLREYYWYDMIEAEVDRKLEGKEK